MGQSSSQTLVDYTTTPLLSIKNDVFEVKMTYTDEEGDEIDFSTDEEFADAILFLQRQIPAEGFAVVDAEPAEECDDEEEEEDGVVVKKRNKSVLRVNAIVKYKKVATAFLRETRDEVNGPPYLPFFGIKKKADKTTKGGSSSCRSSLPHGLGEGPNPIFNAMDTFFSAMAQAVEQLKEPMDKRCESASIDYFKSNISSPVRGFDPHFVHSRHACDGCNCSPIVGYRYHSTTIPNFDLCHACMMKLELPDVEFKLSQYKPDRVFSYKGRQYPFWKSIRPTRPAQRPINTTPRPSRDDIERAVQQSFDDLKKINSAKTTADETTTTNDEATDTFETVAATTTDSPDNATESIENIEEPQSTTEEDDTASCEDNDVVVVERTSETTTTTDDETERVTEEQESHDDDSKDEPVTIDTDDLDDASTTEDKAIETDDNEEAFVSLENPSKITVDFDEESLEKNSAEKQPQKKDDDASSKGSWDVVDDDFQ